jgi:preprotein translocase subunit SecB
MSMASNGGPAAAPPPQAGGQPQASGQPQLGVVAQYVKDFSFENPNAPRSLQAGVQPQIGIQINVNANALATQTPGAAPTDFEVELKLEGKAEGSGSVLFSFELSYAGIFRIQNVPQESLQPLVMIECPRLLFPFAREIISSATRNGGFPPLLLDPIDFVGLYQQRLAQQAQAQQAAPPKTA